MLSRTGVLYGNFARADSIIYRMLAHESSRFALVYYTLGRFSLRFEQAPYLNVAAQSSTDLPLVSQGYTPEDLGEQNKNVDDCAKDNAPCACSVRHLCNADFELRNTALLFDLILRLRIGCVYSACYGLWFSWWNFASFESSFSAARTYPPSLAAHS